MVFSPAIVVECSLRCRVSPVLSRICSYCYFVAAFLLAFPSVAQEGAVNTPPEVWPSPDVRGTPSKVDYQALESFVDWLADEASEADLPGVAMSIVSSQSVEHLETWGRRREGESGDIDVDTVFRIASVSKTFAGTVAALMVQHGIVEWDEPLLPLLPGLRLGTEAVSEGVTLRHVASHSTGLMPHAYSNLLDAGILYPDIRNRLHEVPTVCAPGDCYGYQNVVFSLIADVVETHLQTRYSDFVRENIFLPLGMRTASMSIEAYEAQENASSPHRYARGSWHPSTINEAYFSVGPASGVNASIRDMSRWAQANLGAFPDVLQPALLASVHKPVVATPYGGYFNRWPGVERAWYAAGWRVYDYNGIRVVHHGGGVRGFRTEMVLVPALDIAMVVLFNAQTCLLYTSDAADE